MNRSAGTDAGADEVRGALVAGTGKSGHHCLGGWVMVERATGVSRWRGETC